MQSFDVITTLTPIMESSMTQIVDMISKLLPYTISIALFGAGIYLVRSMISSGTRSIG